MVRGAYDASGKGGAVGSGVSGVVLEIQVSGSGRGEAPRRRGRKIPLRASGPPVSSEQHDHFRHRIRLGRLWSEKTTAASALVLLALSWVLLKWVYEPLLPTHTDRYWPWMILSIVLAALPWLYGWIWERTRWKGALRPGSWGAQLVISLIATVTVLVAVHTVHDWSLTGRGSLWAATVLIATLAALAPTMESPLPAIPYLVVTGMLVIASEERGIGSQISLAGLLGLTGGYLVFTLLSTHIGSIKGTYGSSDDLRTYVGLCITAATSRFSIALLAAFAPLLLAWMVASTHAGSYLPIDARSPAVTIKAAIPLVLIAWVARTLWLFASSDPKKKGEVDVR